VSSYDRNTFTRGAPCLCLVRCLLYTSVVATCRSTPHLRRRNNRRSPPSRIVPLGTSRATSSPGPKCSWCAVLLALQDLRCRSVAVRAFGSEGQHRSDKSPLHNKTHITQVAFSVSVKPAPPGLPRVSRSYVRAETVSLAGRGQSFRRSFSPTAAPRQ
jgi:hypothetical protein